MSNFSSLPTHELIWVSIGFLGQALFSARFLVQWLHSEREKRSVIPVAFWYLSCMGGMTLFTYALYRQDPVFICGQGFGLIVYIRNIMLIKSENGQTAL